MQRYCFGDILHEDSAFELQLGLPVLGKGLHSVLLLVGIHLFTTEQNPLEQINLVLGQSSVGFGRGENGEM